MLSIHPKVNDFGDKGETINETDETNKEDMKEFCIINADQKSENAKHIAKYDKLTTCKFWRKKNK